MANTIVARLVSYFGVLVLFLIAAFYLPVTLFTHPLMLITSPSNFRSKWFENFWKVIGPRQGAQDVQVATIDELMSRVKGVVLDVGPGTGEQSYHFRAGQIEMVYGIEPNQFMHERLLEKAKAAGLAGKYTAVLAGAQPDSLLPALRKHGIISKNSSNLPDKGIFDSIVAIKVLCSVPREHTMATIAVFQRLLKPGGELVFFEHVENNSDRITQTIVAAVGGIWSLFAGGCRLDSKVDRAVLSMGGWKERHVQTVEEFQGYEIIRYVKGVCVKA